MKLPSTIEHSFDVRYRTRYYKQKEVYARTQVFTDYVIFEIGDTKLSKAAMTLKINQGQ